MTFDPLRRTALSALGALAALGLDLGALGSPTGAAAATRPGPAQGRRRRPSAAVADDGDEVVIYGHRDDVMAFAADTAQRYGLDIEWLRAQLAQARFQPKVTRLVMPPPAGTAKNWASYRDRFVEPKRIQAGLHWWDGNAAWLNAAQARWGVPPEIVVGIVGVETYYGRVRGNFRTLDALTTLAFDFPSGRSDRSSFYRDELASFLRWCAGESRDPQGVRGSYAGAMGWPQFMPSSILNYAVDFDGDGHIDLDSGGADVVGSVAHYLASFGWQPGMPTHFRVDAPVATSERALLLQPDITPSFTPEQMRDHGAVLDAAGRQHPGLLALVELENGDAAPTFVAGTQNFYVVTRYNHSSYYAMAVIELGRAVKAMRPATDDEPPAPVMEPAASIPAAASAPA
jgi:membrane-bound lytic murein transglycosylase B